MGNCLRKNQVSAHDENEEGKKVEQINTSSSSKLEPARGEENMKKKKVRFKIQDGRGNHSNCSNGSRRIRVVVTKQELKRILSYKNDVQHTSLKQLLSDMKLREKRLCEVQEYHDGGINSWRPALESIPEDRSMK